MSKTCFCDIEQVMSAAYFDRNLTQGMCKVLRRANATRLKIAGSQEHEIVRLVSAQIDSEQARKKSAADKKYPPSTYGTDMQSCLSGFESLGVDGKDICNQKYGGKGIAVGNRQINQAWRDQKEQQQAAAQNSRGTIQHITARNAAIKEVDETPAFIKTHDYLFNKTQANYRDESSQPQLKSATVEDNRPTFLKTRSRFVEAMAELRMPTEVKPTESVELTPQQQQLKSASVESVMTSEPHPYIKRIQHLIGEGEFI